MNTVISDSLVFITYAVLAILFQNAIFSRALGVSRLVQLIGDEDTSSYYFGAILCVVQLLSAPLGYYLNLIMSSLSFKNYLIPFSAIVNVAIVSLLILGALKLLKQKINQEVYFAIVSTLPVAAFNSGVVGTLLVTTKQSYTLLQSLGFGVGSGIGYVFAVALVSSAQKKLRSPAIPKAFRGLPITLLYIGIIALAIYGFTGHTVII